jgi:hypothetical protein
MILPLGKQTNKYNSWWLFSVEIRNIWKIKIEV